MLALVVTLLVVGESAGVARAFDAGSRVDCCCGSHAIARACHCLHCPTALRHARKHQDARITAPDRCQPALHDGLLVVTAVIVAAPTVAASVFYTHVAPAGREALRSIALDPARPPP
jgi:hypothetical protein